LPRIAGWRQLRSIRAPESKATAVMPTGHAWQIEEYLATGAYFMPTDRDRYDMMKTYYLMLEDHGESDAVGKMKQFATYFTHGVRNGSKLRTEIYRAASIESILEIVDRFFTSELNPAADCVEVA
jgi:tRNA-dihydrouridine synthase